MSTIDPRILIVDPEDQHIVDAYNWSSDGEGRIRTSIAGKTIRLHQLILPGFKLIDHKDGNNLNNKKINLRPATVAQNGWNRGKTKANTTGYKGVFKHPNDSLWNKFFARIVANQQRYHLGFFHTAEEAAVAYDKECKRLHGEFARVNFPEDI